MIGSGELPFLDIVLEVVGASFLQPLALGYGSLLNSYSYGSPLRQTPVSHWLGDNWKLSEAPLLKPFCAEMRASLDTMNAITIYGCQCRPSQEPANDCLDSPGLFIPSIDPNGRKSVALWGAVVGWASHHQNEIPAPVCDWSEGG